MPSSGVLLGKYSRSRPLVFSLVPRCQGQRALQKWTGAPSGSWRAGPGANSWPRSTVRGGGVGGRGPLD